MANLRDVHQAMLEAQLAKLEGMLRKRYLRSVFSEPGSGRRRYLGSAYTLLFLAAGGFKGRCWRIQRTHPLLFVPLSVEVG